MSLSALDRLEIVELQSIYAWGIDLKDGSVFAQAFHEDIETDYGHLGTMKGLEFFRRWMDAFHAPFDSTQHLISNHWLTPDGDEVVYRSYVIATLTCKGTPGGDSITGGGRYVDRVVRTDAGWRIRTREVQNMWRNGNMGIFDVGRAAVADLVAAAQG
jgi:SnoaL-like protein